MKITKKLLAALMAAVMLLSAAPLAGLNLTAEAANSSSTTESHKHKKVSSVKKATLSKNGATTVKCSTCNEVLGKKTIYKIASVTLNKSSYTYTGKEIKPDVTVKDSKGKTLKAGTDYTVAFKNNKEIGKATVTVTFKGNYSGTKKLTLSILPKIKTDSTKDSVTVSWTKVPQAKSYKIALHNGKKLVKSAASTKTSAKFSSLSPSTKYTVKLTALNGKKTVTSAETTVKTLSKDSVRAYRTEKYLKTISKGTYLETAKTKIDGIGTVTTTAAGKNGNGCVKSNQGGITTRTISLPPQKGQKYPTTYIVIDDYKVYTKIPDEYFEQVIGNEDIVVESIEPAGKVSAVKVKEGQKTLVRESYKTKGGLKVSLYFDGETPVREEVTYPDGTTFTSTITKFTTDVPDSLFKIPKSYTYLSFSEFMGTAG